MKAALAIEDAARDAVREPIVSAAEVASQQEGKWLDLAEQTRDEESGFVKVLRSLSRARADDAPDGSDEAAEAAVIKPWRRCRLPAASPVS
ncbi:hypothetical protein [Micromonospora sp. NPDC049497]|uniref:hypothetical protein n=1 Tax=Micromonospora sp. NPDC049497 TaxID=3364273 RepID=UPI0037977488